MPVLHPGRWLTRSVLIVATIVLAALVALNLRLFVWPTTDAVEPADAVVVLAGGDGERLDRGLELVNQGVAPTLALSFGPNRLCNFEQTFSVVCFTPSPENTRGEAEAIGRLAADRGWTNLVLVTSTPHVTRARLLIERCYSGNLQVTAANPRQSLPGWTLLIVHEWGGLAAAITQPDC